MIVSFIAMKERKSVPVTVMMICIFFTWLIYESGVQEWRKNHFNIKANPKYTNKLNYLINDVSIAFRVSHEREALQKRANIDLNVSPTRSDSPPPPNVHPISDTTPLAVRPIRQLPPNAVLPVSQMRNSPSKSRGVKRKQGGITILPAVASSKTEKEERKRANQIKAMNNFRGKWNKAGFEKAKQTLDPVEFSQYKEKYDHYRKQEIDRSAKGYEKEKQLLKEKDPAAIERREKKLQRYRQYYQNVTKKRQKIKKDTASTDATGKSQNTSKPFSKRADQEKPELQIGTDAQMTTSSPQVEASTKDITQPKLELKRKRSRDYNAKFTKKAYEQASKTLSKEEFENYQETFSAYRAKRARYAKVGSERLKANALAGDQQAIQRQEHRSEAKRVRQRKRNFGTFLSVGLTTKKPHGNLKIGDDETLKGLLERPIDSQSRRDIVNRLKSRERNRNSFKEQMALARIGDEKGKEWHNKRTEYNRNYMQKYRTERKKAKLRGANPSASPD